MTKHTGSKDANLSATPRSHRLKVRVVTKLKRKGKGMLRRDGAGSSGYQAKRRCEGKVATLTVKVYEGEDVE